MVGTCESVLVMCQFLCGVFCLNPLVEKSFVPGCRMWSCTILWLKCFCRGLWGFDLV